MSNTNILASVQQERLALIEIVAYLTQKPASEVDLLTDIMELHDAVVNTSDEIGMTDLRLREALEREKVIMPLLAKLYDWCAEIGHYPTPEEDTDYLQTCEQVDGLLTAWQARQSARQPSAVPAGDRNEHGA